MNGCRASVTGWLPELDYLVKEITVQKANRTGRTWRRGKFIKKFIRQIQWIKGRWNEGPLKPLEQRANKHNKVASSGTKLISMLSEPLARLTEAHRAGNLE